MFKKYFHSGKQQFVIQTFRDSTCNCLLKLFDVCYFMKKYNHFSKTFEDISVFIFVDVFKIQQ